MIIKKDMRFGMSIIGLIIFILSIILTVYWFSWKVVLIIFLFNWANNINNAILISKDLENFKRKDSE